VVARRPGRVAWAFPPLALGLVTLSWITLLVWDASPYGRYLNHGDWTTIGLGAAMCAVVPGGSWLVPGLLYGGGWLLMSAAMMLPTSLPLIRMFDRLIAGRSDRAALHGLLIAGYLLAWGGFGAAAHLLDQALHSGLGGWTWLAVHPWIPGTIVLALAGAFQFSSLKYHCLDKCRTPLSFVTSHWHGPYPFREAFGLGLAHGAYCVGCCWAIMLLMFIVGTGNVGWMLALGLLMAIEKNALWGRRMSQPLGYALLVWAGIISMVSVLM
jgi:predicted metal-binding membrane protein